MAGIALQRERGFLLLLIDALGPSAFPPARPRRGQPRGGALADEVALELGQRREDVEDEFATGGRGVDVLLQALECTLS